MSAIICYRCGQKGHYAYACPRGLNTRILNIIPSDFHSTFKRLIKRKVLSIGFLEKLQKENVDFSIWPLLRRWNNHHEFSKKIHDKINIIIEEENAKFDQEELEIQKPTLKEKLISKIEAKEHKKMLESLIKEEIKAKAEELKGGACEVEMDNNDIKEMMVEDYYEKAQEAKEPVKPELKIEDVLNEEWIADRINAIKISESVDELIRRAQEDEIKTLADSSELEEELSKRNEYVNHNWIKFDQAQIQNRKEKEKWFPDQELIKKNQFLIDSVNKYKKEAEELKEMIKARKLNAEYQSKHSELSKWAESKLKFNQRDELLNWVASMQMLGYQLPFKVDDNLSVEWYTQRQLNIANKIIQKLENKEADQIVNQLSDEALIHSIISDNNIDHKKNSRRRYYKRKPIEQDGEPKASMYQSNGSNYYEFMNH